MQGFKFKSVSFPIPSSIIRKAFEAWRQWVWFRTGRGKETRPERLKSDMHVRPRTWRLWTHITTKNNKKYSWHWGAVSPSHPISPKGHDAHKKGKYKKKIFLLDGKTWEIYWAHLFPKLLHWFRKTTVFLTHYAS